MVLMTLSLGVNSLLVSIYFGLCSAPFLSVTIVMLGPVILNSVFKIVNIVHISMGDFWDAGSSRYDHCPF